MGKAKGAQETTPELRNRMVGMYEAGLGLKEIAASVNCSQRTVKRWLNRFNKEGNVETRDRSGRKRATTQEQDDAIIRLATETPITAAKAVLPALGLNCSVDTIRERLHKAGIHNWSPSKKQIQKIPVADNTVIQQSVWRPTGTQLGKKKNKNSVVSSDKTKISNSAVQVSKKKKASEKETLKDKNNASEKLPEPQQTVIPEPDLQTNFSNFLNLQVNERAKNMQIIPTSLSDHHASIPNNPNQYEHMLNLNLLPQSQILSSNAESTGPQHWPLDLVQNNFTQTAQNSVHNGNSDLPLQLNPQQIVSQYHSESQIQVSQHEHQNEIELPSNTQESSINVCLNSNNNSNSSLNTKSQNLSSEKNEKNTSLDKSRKKNNKIKFKKKKGGKAKGTLETSVELRNRMIGMSEAGLSSLSIALAINRSERTVKRWLDRWKREGNVQTKERKGRKRITTKEQDDAIIAMATQNPLTAAKFVAPALGLKCSVDTIRERLHKAGIHSWKLGKKQTEGNSVQMVHLWQPSGNRSNKIKLIKDNKKKKSLNIKKRSNKASHTKNQNLKKESIAKTQDQKEAQVLPETSQAPENVEPEETEVHFSNQSHTASLLQPSHSLSTNSLGNFSQPHQQLGSLSQIHQQTPLFCPQPLPAPQPICPIMQPRPDCRLSLAAIPHAPSMPPSVSNNIGYPSCMMANNNHSIHHHMEQTETMSFEPYIWSF